MYSSRFKNTNADIVMLKNVFLSFDQSCSGRLSLEDFTVCIQHIEKSKQISQLEIAEMMSMIDLDGDGYLN